jgi:hypothetical protein
MVLQLSIHRTMRDSLAGRNARATLNTGLSTIECRRHSRLTLLIARSLSTSNSQLIYSNERTMQFV